VPTRRTFLLGGAGIATAGLVGAGIGIEQGLLPGRPFLQAELGLNGEDGTIPDVAPGLVEQGSFVSAARGGVETGWLLIMPPGIPPDGLPVVVALHGLGASHATLTGPEFGIDRFLAAYVEGGGTPFAIAAAQGGTTYWHPRPNGEDAGRMVTHELLPLVKQRGLDVARIGLIGWSMGGYGALRLAGLRGPDHTAAVVASSPALWSDPGEASSSGFADAAEYERESIYDNQAELVDIPVRVDIGTGDPYYRDVQDYVDGFPDDALVTSTFEPGGHTTGYWRRMLPAQLAYLGTWADSAG
jgi:enterochelin esterase-like enzyme